MTTPPSPAAPPPGCPAHRLYGPEAEADPMGLYEKLRAEHGSVAPVLVHGDLPAWLVLGHRENLDVARTPSRFSRDSRLWHAMRDGKVPADHPLAPIATWQPVCNFQDGPEHQRLRAAVTESLERFDRRGVRRYVKRFADQLLDGFADSGRADLVEDFAEPLPMLVMTQLLGAPESYGPRLVEAGRDMIKGTETAVASNAYVTETLRQLLARKREVPGRDFTSWLLEHSTALTEEEIVEHLRLVLIAAFSTTANLIANTLRLVLTDRRFRANLSGGHMTLPDALEQVLWDEPPLTTILGRWATGDTRLGGQHIKAGDMLLLGLAAANADPAIRPDLTVPVHGNRSHLAFSGGPHECPGQDIGRAIADTGIDTLLSRLPDVELAVAESDLRWESSLMSRELAALPVTFTPRGATLTTATAVAGTSTAQPLPEAVTASAVPAPVADRAPVGAPWWKRLLGRR
ncbi:cytochrome [Streptomyces sp. CB03234]|uniref:cytochrome P450 n=1 Tax=Streptomyces sp. (strain CB03234) TaxID=1703937 RepID=UPI00093FB5BD|nr:cytochrome P450 [Streptomyces sp. CB03234]OKK07831.1 cytochrome [Streptomyces sp. CB03234]